MSQSRVNFAVFIDVGCDHPGAGGEVYVVDAAFTNVDVETHVPLASGMMVSISGMMDD